MWPTTRSKPGSKKCLKEVMFLDWLIFVIGVILAYLIISSFIRLLNLKKNIVESKLGMGVYFKKKERLIERLIVFFKQKDPNFIEQNIFEKMNEFSRISEVDRKISDGEVLTKLVCDAANKNLHLRIDGDIATLISELKIVDEKILEFKKKYNMSVMAYDIARKKSILFFFFRKHKESNNITDIEE